MHVLTLTPFYPTPTDDACGCFIAESVAETARRGIESSVIAVHPAHRGSTGVHSMAPPATSWKYFSIPGNAGLSTAGSLLYTSLKSELRRLHALKPYGIIHAHGALPCGHAAMKLSRELGIPFVVTVHGLDVFSTRQVSGWLGWRCAEISKEVYRSAARVICISEHVAQLVRDELKQEATIRVVYNGVDATRFVPSANDDRPNLTVLSIGNLIPIKGHDLLLRAIESVCATHPQVNCRIIGEGPERAPLQRLARSLSIEDRAVFLGRQPRAEVARHIAECTLFALPSWYEGLGCVYLEAMSAERPVIGCFDQGIEEVIRQGENAWLVRPNNLGDLTAALSTLLSDRSLRQCIGRKARQTILNGFTLAHQAGILLAVYRECV